MKTLFFATRIMTLDVFHCLVITVPYHYVADWRKYLVWMQHTNGRGNIDAIDRVGVATDSNLAKVILFCLSTKASRKRAASS